MSTTTATRESALITARKALIVAVERVFPGTVWNATHQGLAVELDGASGRTVSVLLAGNVVHLESIDRETLVVSPVAVFTLPACPATLIAQAIKGAVRARAL